MREYHKIMMMSAAMSSGGYLPDLEKEVEKSVFGGASSELDEHLQRSKRTIQEEYELIQQKKSLLTKRMREYVEYLYTKTQDGNEKGEGQA
jgi:hypothetical protein